MDFSVTILGNSAALPASNRNTSAQVVHFNQKLFLLDCGEGTQNRIRDLGIKFTKATHIFISHLHGDHYYGLPGLITSLHLNRRQASLTLISPPGLREIIEVNLKASDTKLSFPIHFEEVFPTSNVVYEDEYLRISIIPMQHRIPCYGYLFQEKNERVNMRTDALSLYRIPVDSIESIKNGADYVTEEGLTIPHANLVKRRPKRSYAFCSDTIYTDQYLDKIKGVDLLYHESTFLKTESDKARERFHCTAEQAAMIARDAGVKQLLLGHFSSRYPSEKLFEEEAKAIFNNTISSIEGETYRIE